MMDFFDALREASQKKVRLRYRDGLWRTSVFSDEGIQLVDGSGISWMLAPELRDEKAWQVEPESEKLVDFPEAFAAALRGEEIMPEGAEFWSIVRHNENGAYFVNISKRWYPTEGQRKGKWRIKPKEKKENAVFVWGVCCDDETSWLFFTKPEKTPGGGWLYSAGFEGHKSVKNNLFPKDRPQRFILKLVDENE